MVVKSGVLIRIWQSAIVTALLYLIVCLTWGTTWLGIKIAVDSVPPLTAAGARFLIAFPLFLALVHLAKVPLRFPKEHRLFFVFVTLFYFSVPYYLISYGEQFVSSGLTSLIFSSMPVFILIFSAIILKEKIWLSQLVGILIGFASLFMIIKAEGLTIEHSGLLGVFAILCAAIMHGFTYVYTKKIGVNISVITYNTLPIGVAGFLLFFAGLMIEQPDLVNTSANSWWALVYLGLVASVGGFIVYFHLLKRMSPVALSFIFIIFPVFAIGLGAWYEDRPVTEEFMVFSGLMLLGFAITKLPFGKLSEVLFLNRKLSG